MYIKKIIDYDADSQEGDVIVTDGKFEIKCFAIDFSGRCDVSFNLSAFGCYDIMTASNNEYVVKKLESERLEYFLQGKLLNVNADEGIVKIGELLIKDVGWIPKDIKEGEFIELSVDQIELQEIKS